MEAGSFDAYLMTNETSVGDILQCNSLGDETLCSISNEVYADGLPTCSGQSPIAFLNAAVYSVILPLIACNLLIALYAPKSSIWKRVIQWRTLLANSFSFERGTFLDAPRFSLTKLVDRAAGSVVSLSKKEGGKPRIETPAAPALGLPIATPEQIADMSEEAIIQSALQGKVPVHSLEKVLGDPTKAIKIRRAVVARNDRTKDHSQQLEASQLPYEHYDFARVAGACCENVIGYMPVPVGVAGPINVNGHSYYIPMATTEGALVASTSRGCKALNSSADGVTSIVLDDGMSRGPCVRFPNLTRAATANLWIRSPQGQTALKKAFDSSSRFARLQKTKTTIAGSDLYIRFTATTGDAMGMNMISKGVEAALSDMVKQGFEDMNILSVSGNYCTDKKAGAMNWIEGRGKSVVAQATIPAEVVKKTLKTDVASLVDLNESKNLVGSAMAGSIGGFNAHAANIVTAIFIATGQDPAQNVESSSCMTTIRRWAFLNFASIPHSPWYHKGNG